MENCFRLLQALHGDRQCIHNLLFPLLNSCFLVLYSITCYITHCGCCLSQTFVTQHTCCTYSQWFDHCCRSLPPRPLLANKSLLLQLAMHRRRETGTTGSALPRTKQSESASPAWLQQPEKPIPMPSTASTLSLPTSTNHYIQLQ